MNTATKSTCTRAWHSSAPACFAKLSQTPTPAPAGWLSLALFSFTPTTRPAGRNSSEIDGNQQNLLSNSCRSTLVKQKPVWKYLKRWKTTSMEDDLNGRQPQWKTTSMEDDLNGRRPQWKTTSMEDNLNRRRPQRKMSSM
jgi:hypothetical protein